MILPRDLKQLIKSPNSLVFKKNTCPRREENNGDQPVFLTCVVSNMKENKKKEKEEDEEEDIDDNVGDGGWR